MTQPRLIRLDQWLQIMFGDNPPTHSTPSTPTPAALPDDYDVYMMYI